MHGRVEVFPIESELLRGNPLEASPLRHVPVYVPEGDGPFPAAFQLAAFTGGGRTVLNRDWYAPNLFERVDALIASAAMPPVVVIAVDALTWLGGSQYIDSSAAGPWARHVVEELVPWAESRLPVKPGRAHRGVFGHSSGGYGALRMAFEHADTFAGIAASAADCYFEYVFGPEFPKAALGLQSVGGTPTFLKRLRTRDWPKFPGNLFPALTVVAMSHFFSPDPDAPLGFRLPFDEGSGARDEDVLRQWRRHDPVFMLEAALPALRTLSYLGLEVGSRDEYHLQLGARMIARGLAEAGVDHHYEEHDGGHRGIHHRVETYLPPLVRALG